MQIGIIGAGTMGAGIAEATAAGGHDVILTDIDLARAEKGKAGIAKGLARLVAKEKIAQKDADALLARITPRGDTDDFRSAALVIEAATENADLKEKIYAGLGDKLGADTILASNTSSISITRLGASAAHPDRFVGVHFFNPAPRMQLVEITPGLATAPATTEKVKAFVQSLGKTGIVCKDSPCFIVNRVLCPMVNEAIFALGEGVGSVADIDTAVRLGANHPMGPLTLADFIGLDVMLSVMRVMVAETGDQKYRPAPLLVKYVQAGWLGRKSGRGFYDYSGKDPVPTI